MAHHLYWLLHQCLPADGGEPSVTEARYRRRLTVLQRALRSTCGQNMLSRFLSQEVLLRVSTGGRGGGGDAAQLGEGAFGTWLLFVPPASGFPRRSLAAL